MKNRDLAQLDHGNQILIKRVFTFCVHHAVLKRQLQNRPPPPLHLSTLYPLQRFLPVDLDPLLPWITLRACVNKACVTCSSVCSVKRDVAPTCVRISEDPNLLGVNQDTCLECALCRWLACRPDGLLVSQLFVSPLESSVLYENQLNLRLPRI